ncbi:MAG: 2-oxoglutarate and iron-dependent oxygenase domain-containing protein [Pseudomonadota bacterium]
MMGKNPLPPRLLAKRESFDRIPVIDLAGLLSGADKQGVARDINHALRTSGFMYVKNHGMDPAFVAQVFDVTRAFFDLPLDDKMALHISNSGPALRGYIEVFGENTDPEKTKDLKECFDIGPERETVSPFFGPNPWPPALPEFATLTYAYHQQMVGLAKAMLRGIALSLDLSEDYFADKTRDPISIQRMLHYPPQNKVVDESVMGIGAHTDYGNLTILAQDDVGGLQVMNRDGDWVEAPPIPGTFVINIGDLIQRLTNDVYLANLHRVINTTGRERYSIPFFLDADFDAVFEPLDRCITPDNPRVYEPVSCGDHKYSRFKTSYAHLADVPA